MNLNQSRWRVIGLLVLIIALAPVMAKAAVGNDGSSNSGLSNSGMSNAAMSDADIVHFLNRISFGPAPGDIEAVKKVGFETYLEAQLHPQSFTVPAQLQERLNALPTLAASIKDLATAYQPPQDLKQMSPEDRKAYEKQVHTIVEELAQAKILRAVASPAQLEEVMVDFWFNHFNVFEGKAADRVFVSSYERDAIRPYALGRFRDLLEATARHPAMLFYLDNWENTDPNSAFARKVAQRQGKEIGINENYAREIMELHTLGVEGGYNQEDVTALAHILTGWGLQRGPGLASKAVFEFDPNRHDQNAQMFLGRPFEGGGGDEVDRAFDLLAYHPSTAKHIAYELAQYFVADQPPESLVDKLAATFTRSQGNISETLKVLFHSEEFWSSKSDQVKFKPPFRYVVSVLRASGIFPEGDTKKLQGAINQMGEPLYHCLTPNGYAITNDQWLNSDAVLKRINFAQSLKPFLRDNGLTSILQSFGQTWSQNTRATVNAADPMMRPVLLLGSPEFVYY